MFAFEQFAHPQLHTSMQIVYKIQMMENGKLFFILFFSFYSLNSGNFSVLLSPHTPLHAPSDYAQGVICSRPGFSTYSRFLILFI